MKVGYKVWFLATIASLTANAQSKDSYAGDVKIVFPYAKNMSTQRDLINQVTTVVNTQVQRANFTYLMYGDRKADGTCFEEGQLTTLTDNDDTWTERTDYDWLTGLAVGLNSFDDDDNNNNRLDSAGVINENNFRLVLLVVNPRQVRAAKLEDRDDDMTMICSPKSISAIRRLIENKRAGVILVQDGVTDNRCEFQSNECSEIVEPLLNLNGVNVYTHLDSGAQTGLSQIGYLKRYLQTFYRHLDLKVSDEAIDENISVGGINSEFPSTSPSIDDEWYKKPVYIALIISTGVAFVSILGLIFLIVVVIRQRSKAKRMRMILSNAQASRDRQPAPLVMYDAMQNDHIRRLCYDLNQSSARLERR